MSSFQPSLPGVGQSNTPNEPGYSGLAPKSQRKMGSTLPIIRPVEETDAEAVIALGREMYERSAYKDLPFSESVVRNNVARIIGAGDGVMFVAEHNGEIIGMLAGSLSMFSFSYELYAKDHIFYVRQDMRGVGMVAVRLLKAFVEWARSKKVARIVMGNTAFPDDERVRALFRTLDFKDSGIVMMRKV